jgi:hypothetical protein
LNPFQISTDNLYKFISLSGIGLIVLCLMFVYPKANSLELEALKLKNEKDIISKKYEDLTYDYEQLSLEIDDIDKRTRKELKQFFELLDIDRNEILKILKPEIIEVSNTDLFDMIYSFTKKKLESRKNSKSIKNKVFDTFLETQLETFEVNIKEIKKDLDLTSKKRDELFIISNNHFDNEFKLIGKEDELLLLQKQLKEQYLISALLILVGSIMSVVGFYLWYSRIQKPADIEIMQKITNSHLRVKNIRKKGFNK